MAVEIGKLRNMSPEELTKEEVALREEMWKLRLQRSTGQSQGPALLLRARRDLARVLTVRRQHELEEGNR